MKSRTKILFFLFLATLFSTFGIITSSVKNESIKDYIKENKQVSLIPRKVLFGNPEKTHVEISPNGQWISYLAPHNGVLNVWIEKVGDKDSKKLVTQNTQHLVHNYSWAYDGQHIIYSDDKNGDENWRLYSVNISTLEKRALAEFDDVQATIVASNYQFPEEIVIGLNQRRSDFHDLYRINVRTGEKQLLWENNEFIEFVLNDKLEPYLGLKRTDDGRAILYALTVKKKPILYIDQEDVETLSLVTLNKTNEVVYLIDSHNRNTGSLTAFHLQTGKTTLIAEDKQTDISEVLIHPIEKHVQAFVVNHERKKWQSIEQSLQKEFDYLTTLTTGELEITSRSLDDKDWIVAFIRDQGAPHYYHYDRTQKKANFLFSGNSKLDLAPLVKMHPVVIPSRDNLSLLSYLSLPFPSTMSSIKSPVPLVLLVHGGPQVRDEWGYYPLHQWLANRGYAVLSVNYRGSAGFGKQFLNAGDGEWAGKMHTDLIDAVNWAIQQGITTKEQVAIMGGSYGGYATLVGLTFTPDIFACGVDIVGISNLETFINTIPPYWKPLYSFFKRIIGGDPITLEGKKFLASRLLLRLLIKFKNHY